MEGCGFVDFFFLVFFMLIVRVFIVNFYQEKKILICRFICDCKEMRDNSGYVLGDVFFSKKKVDNVFIFLGMFLKYNLGICW